MSIREIAPGITIDTEPNQYGYHVVMGFTDGARLCTLTDAVALGWLDPPPVELTDEQVTRFEAAAARGMEVRAAIREAVTPLVVAVDRYVDRHAESDEKLSLWRKMTEVASDIAERYGVYPLASEPPPPVVHHVVVELTEDEVRDRAAHRKTDLDGDSDEGWTGTYRAYLKLGDACVALVAQLDAEGVKP